MTSKEASLRPICGRQGACAHVLCHSESEIMNNCGRRVNIFLCILRKFLTFLQNNDIIYLYNVKLYEYIILSSPYEGERKLKKKIMAVIALVLSALMLFVISAVAFDANDYDYSYDGGSGWDSDDDWGGGSTYFFSSSDSDGGSGGGGGIGLGVVVVIIIIVVVLVASRSKGGNGQGGNDGNTGGGVRPANGGQGLNVNVPDRTSQIEQIIKQDDPNFTADDFTSFVKEVYIDIQNAWCKRDLTPVRPVMHTNLYNTTAKQVQSKIDQGVTYHYESIAINTAYLTSYVRDNEYEYLTAYLNARYIDYQTDDKTGNVIRGDRNTRWDFRYKMKFMRSVGVKTTSAGDNNMTGHNCPNCGAPLQISSTGVCEYCGSTVTTGLYSWVLSDFSTVRNDTQDDGIRVPQQPQNGGNVQ